jgi:hypothetical protein
MSDYARKYPLTKKNDVDLHRKILCAWKVYMHDSWGKKNIEMYVRISLDNPRNIKAWNTRFLTF